jgi:DNA topoisomerase-1
MTETGLIRDLERRGIGRPSTFAHIVETLKEREYAAVKDIEGVAVDVEEHKMNHIDQTIVSSTIQRMVGAEKSKLVVTEMGRSVANFLSTNFPDIFAYDFTAQMERSLDEIVRGTDTYGAVCGTYDAVIRCAISRVERIMEANAGCVLDDNHSLLMGKHGLVVRETDDKGKHVGFHAVREGVDTGRAMRGEMGLEELVARCGIGDKASVSVYGAYEGHPIEVKKGRYGYYAKWGSKTCNLKRLNVPVGLMTKEDVVGEIVKQGGAREQSVIRVVNDQISVRKGERGMYLMCSRKGLGGKGGGGAGKRRTPKPTFYPLADFWDWFYRTESMAEISDGGIGGVPDHTIISFVKYANQIKKST